MRELDEKTSQEIRDLIVDFFAHECDVDKSRITVDKSRITDQTDIIAELRGDSLMFLSLLAKVRKRYGIGVELKTLARHLMKKPANTVGQVVDLTFAIVKHGEDILKVEL
jgi:acyl carrier protein